MTQHIRFALRMLRREWAFSTMAILTLALGIAAASGLFSVMRHLLWSELPYHQPERLVFVWGANPHASALSGISELPSTWLDFSTYNEQGKSFESMALMRSNHPVLASKSGEAERLSEAQVTGHFFNLLGVKPHRGRFFSMAEDVPGKNDVVVLSYRLWQRRFGASPDVIGQQILLDNQAKTVIGVAGPEMIFPSGNDLPAPYEFGTKTDLWTPIGAGAQQLHSADNRSFPLIARLKPGVSVESAAAEVRALAASIEVEYPKALAGWSSTAVPLKQQTASRARSILWILVAAIACLLLIASANFSQLLLARTMRRSHELGIRAALGAGKSRLVIQMLTENLVLALAGGFLGAAGAALALEILVQQAASTVPYLQDLRLDFTLLGFSTGIAVLLGVVFGLLPAFAGVSERLAETLKQSGKAVTGGGGRSRAALIIAQLALATLLLTVNLLLVRSLWNLVSLDTGFDRQQVATVTLNPDNRYATDADVAAFQARVLDELRRTPTVISAGLISSLPLSGEESLNVVSAEGQQPEHGESVYGDDRRVEGDYFQAMGIEFLEGSGFRPNLSPDAEPVVIVNQTLAQRFFPGTSALGRRVVLDTDRPHRIVGVVEDVRQGTLEAPPRLQIYRASRQRSMRRFGVVARLRGNSPSDLQAFREAIRGVDPMQFISPVSTMDAAVERAVSLRAFWTILLGVFAALAVFITLAGLHASLSYHANIRMPEFGLRAAVGATSTSLARLVLRQGMLYALTGLAIGLLTAFVARPMITSQIYGVGAFDPLSLVGAAAGVLLIALFASITPALRAAKSDPSVVLRGE